MTAEAPPRVALAQVRPGPDLDRNLDDLADMAMRARRDGAQWLLLPEYAAMLHGSGQAMRAAADRAGEVEAAVRGLARDLGMWVLLGSLVVPDGPRRMVNRSLLFDAEGRLAARYDKLHLFDATLPDGRTIRESSAYAAGDEAVAVDTPWGRVGLSICYDLRFPGLYRALARAGARILVVPAAFARATGAAHWHALLRARAIENGAFVLAPATCGDSPGGRASYGHSLALGPWGDTLGELGDEPGCLVVPLDLAAVDRVRAQLPGLAHERAFNLRLIGPSSSFPSDGMPHDTTA
ncbi:MAG: carbon-nitrogen hydrolase family protein [Alcaligenaceae bacterium]|nr:carbon-nitrogen hydrolase family protein [Alcaligenaceae bacterium SAGV5]MPS51581.1 carbon-nitrogen hydrolase family protein [Alcaligenaceae bacterium SAGV3]MPT58999.1 carbon-nitrogen hydrolase family protein [Alcaligenaceae bacterium]